MKERVTKFIQSLQNEIISGLETLEPEKKFTRDKWERPGGGGGDTGVLSGGDIFEKGGVNSAVVHGELPESMMKKFGSSTSKFYATGVSLVIHPRSPKVPTVHANFRYFEQEDRSWFGGGIDLTPYTWNEKAFVHFHNKIKEACDLRSPESYSEFKKACDEYFFLPHRQEHRGIGGVFFDYLQSNPEEEFQFVQKIGSAFLESYLPIVKENKDKEFSEEQKRFQLLRRGRYVEFNLVYDRGTRFGLETKGNIESILMSLPPVVHFDYKPELEATEEERKLMEVFRQPRDWL